MRFPKFKFPAFLRRDKVTLPAWAREKDSARVDAGKVSIVIEADTDGYLAEWLNLLEVQPPAITQYWLEVAYQCAKLDLQAAIEGTDFDPRTAGKPAEFHFTRADSWRLSAWPRGKGIDAATKGREAREHYKRIRGHLPLAS